MPSHPAPPANSVETLVCHADMARIQGDWDQARTLYEQALAQQIHEGAPPTCLTGEMLTNLGVTHLQLHDPTVARYYTQQAISLLVHYADTHHHLTSTACEALVVAFINELTLTKTSPLPPLWTETCRQAHAIALGNLGTEHPLTRALHHRHPLDPIAAAELIALLHEEIARQDRAADHSIHLDPLSPLAPLGLHEYDPERGTKPRAFISGDSPVHPLGPEFAQFLVMQQESFRDKFGRDMGPDDPFLFDPDADTPQPYSEAQFAALTETLFRTLGLNDEQLYAFQQSQVLVTPENRIHLDPTAVAAWDAAIDVYRAHPRS